jgi:hypothetical protein
MKLRPVLQELSGGVTRHRKNVCADLVAVEDLKVEPAARGCLRGELQDLVIYELARVEYDLLRNLNPNRAEVLFNRQRPGLVRACSKSPTLVSICL